jgi:hypothetical protein
MFAIISIKYFDGPIIFNFIIIFKIKYKNDTSTAHFHTDKSIFGWPSIYFFESYNRYLEVILFYYSYIRYNFYNVK